MLWSINVTVRKCLLVLTNCWTLDTTKTGKVKESLLTFRLIVTKYSLSDFSFLKWNFIHQGQALRVCFVLFYYCFLFVCMCVYYKKTITHKEFPPIYALSFSSNTKDCCLYLMHTLPILSNSKTPLQSTWKENLGHQCMGQKQIWLVITSHCWIIWQLNGV